MSYIANNAVRKRMNAPTRRCAFLTMTDSSGYVIDDELAYEPLRALGWQVDAVPWDRLGVAWQQYEIVVIRSPWDYHLHPDAFLAVLADIEHAGVRLENRLQLVRWNLQKSYLRDLAERGIPTIRTLWRDRLDPKELDGLFNEIRSDEIIIKPVLTVNAQGAYRLDRQSVQEKAAELEAYFSRRPFMVQPFAQTVLDHGEYSLIYFSGEHSHTILKTLIFVCRKSMEASFAS